LIILLLILVCVNLLFPQALFDSLINVVNEKLINTQSGNLLIEADGEAAFLSDVDSFISELEDIAGVEAATWRITTGGQIEHDNYTSTFGITVIDPDQYQRVFDLSDYVSEGGFLESTSENSIMLGVQVAGADNEELELYTSSLRNVHAGDDVKVSLGGLFEEDYKVDGVFDTKFVLTDINSFIPADDFFAMQPDRRNTASSIHLKLADTADREQIISEIEGLRGDINIKKWEDTAGLLRSVTDTFQVTIAILQAIALLVAAIAIFIVTYIDLVNKRRQIGIQRAIGVTSTAIMFSYILRALIYAIVGIILGAMFFSYVVIPLEHRYPFEFPFGYATFEFALRDSMWLFVALLVVAIIAAIIPTARTLHKKILDAIWG